MHFQILMTLTIQLDAARSSIRRDWTVKLTGDYLTKVFEGPYRKAKDWYAELQAVADDKGATEDEVYFFYTTCPKCAKAYGKNYVVGVVRID